MATLPTLNQFGQTTTLGALDLQSRGGNVFSCEVSTSQATALVPGQPVKLDTSFAGGVPKVLALSGADDPTFGVVMFVLKDQNYPANARLEIAGENAVMYMNSSGAITRGSRVEVDTSTVGNVKTSGGVNPVIGLAFDGATGANQLIRVLIKAFPNAAGATLKNATVTATLAQINAGLVLVPAVTGQAITVTNFTAIVNGTFLTGTSVELEDTNGTPVAVATFGEAALTNGAILVPASSGVTLGAGFAAPLTTSKGLQVVNNGSAQTGGTSITFNLTYMQN